MFAGDDNHLFFQVGHRLLITRKLTGNFPDYERVLPKDRTLTATLQKEEIRSAIERVSGRRLPAGESRSPPPTSNRGPQPPDAIHEERRTGIMGRILPFGTA
jgi:hypothetical protein